MNPYNNYNEDDYVEIYNSETDTYSLVKIEQSDIEFENYYFEEPIVKGKNNTSIGLTKYTKKDNESLINNAEKDSNLYKLSHVEYKEHINLMRDRRSRFQDFSESARNHISVAKYALKVDIDNAYCLGPDLYDELDILLYIMDENMDIFEEIIPNIKDKSILFVLARKDYTILDYASDKTLRDKDKMIKFVRNNHKSIEYVDDTLFNDINFIKGILEIDGTLIRFLSPEIRNNKELAILAINNDPIQLSKNSKVESAFVYLSEELQKDEYIIYLKNNKTIPTGYEGF